jgi:hypothetical protein
MSANDPSTLDKLGLPAPQGWTVERAVSLLAGASIVATLALARARNPRWRLMTGFIGTNLMLQGWCPASGMLYKLGLHTAGERACD